LGVVAQPWPLTEDADDCQDFLVDQCSPAEDNDPQVEVVHNVDVNDCDFYCNTIYKDQCKFYIQDLKQKICELWKIEATEYRAKCTKHEGPKGDATKVNVAKCITNPDTFGKATDCQGVKQASCMFEGNLLDHLNDIMSEEICQQACQHVPGCKYYVWDSSTANPSGKPPTGGDCELLDSGERQCDMIMVNKGVKADIVEKPFSCNNSG